MITMVRSALNLSLLRILTVPVLPSGAMVEL